jgi:hypothetical protein
MDFSLCPAEIVRPEMYIRERGKSGCLLVRTPFAGKFVTASAALQGLSKASMIQTRVLDKGAFFY